MTQKYDLEHFDPTLFDRSVYLEILKKEGLNGAITALHKDLERLEHACFEGPQGWDRRIFDQIQKLREISRELWDARLAG